MPEQYRPNSIHMPNNVRQFRIERMLTQDELAERSCVARRTIQSVEKGMSCRFNTQRKILNGLGLTFADRWKVWIAPTVAKAA